MLMVYGKVAGSEGAGWQSGNTRSGDLSLWRSTNLTLAKK